VVHIPKWMILAACRDPDLWGHWVIAESISLLRTHCPHIPQAVNKTPRSLNLALGQILRRRCSEVFARLLDPCKMIRYAIYSKEEYRYHYTWVAIGQLIPPTSHWSVGSLDMAGQECPHCVHSKIYKQMCEWWIFQPACQPCLIPGNSHMNWMGVSHTDLLIYSDLLWSICVMFSGL